MGWNELRPIPIPTAADRLAKAVRVWEEHPSCKAREAMLAAVAVYEEAREHERSRPLVTMHVETGRRTGW